MGYERSEVVEDWAAVAGAITARMRELRLTQLDLAGRARVSPATIRELQNNRASRRRYPRTLAALSEALDWPADHLQNVLLGLQDEREEKEPAAEDPVLLELRAIREELRRISDRLDALERHSRLGAG
jgi:transcriptional regulator with XRE-family HTH domain